MIFLYNCSSLECETNHYLLEHTLHSLKFNLQPEDKKFNCIYLFFHSLIGFQIFITSFCYKISLPIQSLTLVLPLGARLRDNFVVHTHTWTRTHFEHHDLLCHFKSRAVLRCT